MLGATGIAAATMQGRRQRVIHRSQERDMSTDLSPWDIKDGNGSKEGRKGRAANAENDGKAEKRKRRKAQKLDGRGLVEVG